MQPIRIRGASENNLRDVCLDLPRNELIVFTGVSGSGKSSLAFETIYREGQRRFLESLPAYARQFLGSLEKPKVESIDGLSPTVSVDQKTVGRSPRSTVGTITEIHDYLRLLYARLGTPHCERCGKLIATQSAEQIAQRVLQGFDGLLVWLCAPLVRERKGSYRKLLEDLRQDGFRRLRIDGELVRLREGVPELERGEKHSIEVIFDRVTVGADNRSRITESIEKTLALSEGLFLAVEEDGDREELYSSLYACPSCGIDLPELEPRLFSFNSPQGACSECEGLGEADRIDGELIVRDASLPFRRGGLSLFLPSGKLVEARIPLEPIETALAALGHSLDASWGDLGSEARRALLDGDGAFPGLVAMCNDLAAVGSSRWLSALVARRPCLACGGARLSASARAVVFRERPLHELLRMPCSDLLAWFESLAFEGSEALIAEPIVRDVISRLRYLIHVGLGYLSLERRSDSLAGGEAQRLRLASLVGGRLRGILYVLDEPSIGLHPRDHDRLLETLRHLRDLGNTVIVVEHDEATMRCADQLVDVGPDAGPRGGELIAQGSIAELAETPRSRTGAYLAGRETIPLPARRRPPQKEWLSVSGVQHNNLKEIDVRFPLGLLIAVTGVSGSGKSSLVNQVLHPALKEKLHRGKSFPGRHRAVSGYSKISKLVVIDQSAIGRTPRSNPATYAKLFDLIRALFAKVPEARSRGYKAGRFSFNKEGGRCLECGGAGKTVVEMQFLAPVEVTCDSCGGKRYNRETLEIRYRGKNVYEVLEMDVAEAVEFFADQAKIRRPLEWMDKVGLGYMKLGQPSTTLSGGEAQRVKLATELCRKESGSTFYILDEPTTGLHVADVKILVEALQELVGRGNTVLVIEHNLDVIKVADHVIDLGPEAGDAGGELVAAGTPEEIAACDASHTGIALRGVLEAVPAPSSAFLPAAGETHEQLAREACSREQVAPDGAPVADASAGSVVPLTTDLVVKGANQHNLRNVSVRIPQNSITVLTGVSGSGKTSLAMHTLFAEGQRRYVESMSTYARRFLGRIQGAPVDSLEGLSPSIAIDQRSAVANPRSTVATITEIYDYLRLLYARVGRAKCPKCTTPLASVSPTRLAAELTAEHPEERAYVLARLPVPGPETAASEDLLRAIEKHRAELMKLGFTRVFVGTEEVRLDEEDPQPVYRIHSLLRGAESGELAVVIDRVVLKSSSQSRLADSLHQAFERGEGWAGVYRVGDSIRYYSRLPACPHGHFEFPEEATPRMFSFSSHLGACERCRGTGVERRAARHKLLAKPDAPLLDGLERNFRNFLELRRPSLYRILIALLQARSIDFNKTAVSEYSTDDTEAVFRGLDEPVQVPLADGERVDAMWVGLEPALESWCHDETKDSYRSALEALLEKQTCSVCRGGRLRPEYLAVDLATRDGRALNIQELVALRVEEVESFFQSLALSERQETIVRETLAELSNRLRFLEEVGLGYLSLDRRADTLSGGEAQRIRLASQLGNRLAGVLYVLDEPTVGLHPRDTDNLLQSLTSLRDAGNTLLLVEHDRDVMERADWIIDMGPGPGLQGGNVIASGTPSEVAQNTESLTGRYLQHQREIELKRPPLSDRGRLEFEGVRHRNLKDISISLPIGGLSVITGVSGSGKSSLLHVVRAAIKTHLQKAAPPSELLRRSCGLETVRRIASVDQRPMGRSVRSNPATFSGLWNDVRELYASLTLSKTRGWGASRFSFNVGDGRCTHCNGQGALEIEMHFLSDVWVTCDHCEGKRFNEETLRARFKGLDISDVLELEIDRACEVFENQPKIYRALATLRDVGLGYLRLGQSVNTLSGGEAQRLKLARELATDSGGGTVFLLDEPTTGLHFEDIQTLLNVFSRLLERGDTVVAIEHHLDVIRCSDWIIDLGPEAADAGGRVVAAGTPAEIQQSESSHTGRCLREMGQNLETSHR